MRDNRAVAKEFDRFAVGDKVSEPFPSANARYGMHGEISAHARRFLARMARKTERRYESDVDLDAISHRF